ncbi:SusC/RagA family protein [Niastella yeongjuensis]|uniref:SusC/RagA family protein n=1 Tax=Niastella yeongjuensis TaxID=354355 RepID=A0A1V9E1M2_9BACT|nr:TonB-dependent receptor [Niastella yeongjuensis]OQP40027.1 SusC/RagA family protein [Niastella yeongjuensis]SEO14041.1 TonB-linked outer membrane protein, SusC/RagA family [Niastella yeongjuensis]
MKQTIACRRYVLPILLLNLLTIFSFAQSNFPVTGKITDNGGNPLQGVTVQVKGSKVVTASNADGSFTINAPSGSSVLVFSSVGFTAKEVALENKGQLAIILSAADNSMDQVVVIGYGAVKRKDVTGAVTGINEKEIKSRPVDNALQAMQGKVAGVDIGSNERPGQVGTINIRGVRSLTASNTPLYVVDGIPLMTGGIEYINPNDIESIDVLKDASATAIYGSRGANGVVIVTTKQGKAGKTNLNLNVSTTAEKLIDRQEQMNSSDYITFRRWARYYQNPSANPRGDNPNMAFDKTIFLATSDPSAWANIAKGWATGTWDGSKVGTTDWMGMVTQTGITKNLNLSVSGGSEKAKMYASFGYLDNSGTTKGQGYTRYTANVNTDINATKWFQFGANLTVSYSIQEFGQSKIGATTVSSSNSLYESARALFPYAVPYDSLGNRIYNPGGDISWKNVADEWNLNQDQRTTLRAFGSLYGQVDFGAIVPALKDLKYRLNFGPDISTYRDGTYVDANSVISSGSNSASLNKQMTYSYTLDHLLYYNKSFGAHDLGLTLLYSQTKFSRDSSFISANGIAFGSQKWNALSKNYIPAANLTGYAGGLTESQLQSFMARINYSLNDKYLLTVSARRDGASMLAEGHKYSWFPSMALAWRMNNEDFLQNATWVNDLKLRFGVGVTGNSAINPYATQGATIPLFYPFTTTTTVVTPGTIPPATFANSTLGWEKTTQYNLGIDFAVLNRRISGSLDIYKSKTTDLLMQMSVPSVNGFTNTYSNIGETSNKGFDFSLTTVNISTRNLSWTTNASISWQKDKITTLANGKQDDINNNWFIGQSIGMIYGYQSAGLWHTEDADTYKAYNTKGKTSFTPGSARPLDVNGDTLIDANHDRVLIGHSRPRWIVGMTNTLAYKNFEFSIFIYGRLGYTYNYGGETETARGVQRQINYYNENNTNAEFQKPFYSEGSGDPYYVIFGYRNGSFLKIRNISLGYNLSGKALKTSAIQNLKAYVQVVNPGMIFSKIDWLDMDVVGPTYNRGITFGINATF